MAKRKKVFRKVVVKVKITGKLCTRNGVRTNYHLCLPAAALWGHVMAKLRKIIKLDESEALYLFINNTIPAMSVCIGSYNLPQISCEVTAESTFGAMGKMFQRCEIKSQGTFFVATITYSYYYLTEFTEKKFCETLQDARNWILKERTHKLLVENDVTTNI